jgi:putative hydroxymethylpyrimidine transport system substrate-binding protein
MTRSARRAARGGLAACVVAAVLASGCGDDEGDGERGSGPAAVAEPTDATLVLDFVPNAVHTGIYCALERGYYEANNVELEVVEPTSTSDTLKLIDQGRAEFGIADGIDVGEQIDRGLGAQAIIAIVQRPLGGVITLREAGIESPRELEGETVGVTGVPSDRAVLDTVVADDRGDPAAVDDVTIGFNTIPALQGGRVDAITGYPPADGTALEQRGEAVRSFAHDAWGGPRYPGLVVFSTRERIAGEPELMRAFVDATVRGYEDTLDDPEGCLDALASEVPELDAELAAAQLDAYLPLFEAGGRPFGALDPNGIRDLTSFLETTDLTERPVPARRFASEESGAAGGD